MYLFKATALGCTRPCMEQTFSILRLINSATAAPESSSGQVFFRASQATLLSSLTIESMSSLKILNQKNASSSTGLGLCPLGLLLLASNTT